jgi:YHS domain-containing protein
LEVFVRFFLSFVLALSLSGIAFAGDKTLLNLDKDGLALQGYDPVAFFTDNKPVKGDPRYVSINKGATYYFASAEHRDRFNRDPGKYAPQFGGYCAYAVSKGKIAPVEIDAFAIVDGRLLMQYDKKVRDTFAQDAKGNLEKADRNWPGVVEKNAR